MTVPVWYSKAQSLLDIAEVPGTPSNSVIIRWAKALGGFVASFYTNDGIPWCGLFVAHCISSTISEEIPKNPLGAREWAKFGRKISKPRVGAILVFSRTGGGHVGFYAGESADAFLVLGGNQSDKVCYSWVAKNRLLSMQWPNTQPIIESGRVFYGKNGKLSTNEK